MEDLTGLINSMKCMQQQLIKISLLKNNIGQVEGLPKNPRLIKDQKYAKLKASLEADPEMMELREVIAYDNNGELVVICGNMRLRALKELGVKGVPVKVLPKETPPEKLRAYTIKDNVGFGEDSWDDLANDWDAVELEEWGLDVPGFDISPDDMGEGFSLPEGDKAPFQQMTFTLADAQATVIQNAINDIKQTDEYKFAETHGNENSNGNALYLIVASWAGQRI